VKRAGVCVEEFVFTPEELIQRLGLQMRKGDKLSSITYMEPAPLHLLHIIIQRKDHK
jgi:hypothetical protein